MYINGEKINRLDFVAFSFKIKKKQTNESLLDDTNAFKMNEPDVTHSPLSQQDSSLSEPFSKATPSQPISSNTQPSVPSSPETIVSDDGSLKFEQMVGAKPESSTFPDLGTGGNGLPSTHSSSVPSSLTATDPPYDRAPELNDISPGSNAKLPPSDRNIEITRSQSLLIGEF